MIKECGRINSQLAPKVVRFDKQFVFNLSSRYKKQEICNFANNELDSHYSCSYLGVKKQNEVEAFLEYMNFNNTLDRSCYQEIFLQPLSFRLLVFWSLQLCGFLSIFFHLCKNFIKCSTVSCKYLLLHKISSLD